MNAGKKKETVLDLSFDFALSIIVFCESLEANRKYVVAKQLLKAGTSIGANVSEAQQAESRADFIHKMKIAAKEASETQYWLELCDKIESYPSPLGLLPKLQRIRKQLARIIFMAKRNIK